MYITIFLVKVPVPVPVLAETLSHKWDNMVHRYESTYARGCDKPSPYASKPGQGGQHVLVAWETKQYKLATVPPNNSLHKAPLLFRANSIAAKAHPRKSNSSNIYAVHYLVPWQWLGLGGGGGIITFSWMQSDTCAGHWYRKLPTSQVNFPAESLALIVHLPQLSAYSGAVLCILLQRVKLWQACSGYRCLCCHWCSPETRTWLKKPASPFNSN